MRSSKITFQDSKGVLFLVAVVALFVLLGIRVVDLQYFQGDRFLALAEENRFYKIGDQAERGAILDRYGQPLAENHRYYLEVEDPEALYSQSEVVAHDEALQLLASAPARLQTRVVRHYPHTENLAQAVGYVGFVTEEERDQFPDVNLDEVIGKTGLERSLDSELRGRAGWREYEVNAFSERQRLVRQQDAVPGKTVVTTLDPYLAQVAQEALGEAHGSVVISDAGTGAILAAVSTPSFDPNVLAELTLPKQLRERDVDVVQELLADPDRPFFNRAVSGAYPPGSVFKLVTALAGLEEGKLDTATTVIDEGVLRVGEFSYANWYYTQYGRTEGEIGLVRSLARSNDIFFYKAAEWTGPDALADMARLVGFGVRPGLGIGPETAGLVPDPAWKEQTVGERWYLGNTYHYGIGQGDLGVSPAQVNKVVQGFANRGTQCQPYVVAQLGEDKQEPSCYELGVSNENLEVVLEGMVQACSSGGTAFPFFEHNQDFAVEGNVEQKLSAGMVACKTGTAEFGPADEQGYRATHGWITVLVEPKLGQADSGAESDEESQEAVSEREAWLERVAETPLPERVVITVLVESDEEVKFREGSADAGPVAARVVEELF